MRTRSASAALGLGGIAGAAAAVTENLAAGVVCAALVGFGAWTWWQRRFRRVGALLVITGGAWLAGGVVPELVLLHRVPLVYLLLSYPTGRVETWTGWVAVAVTSVTALVPALAGGEWATIVSAAVVAAAAVDRFLRSGGPLRKATSLALAATLAYSTMLAVAAVERLATWEAAAGIVLAYEIVVTAIAAVLVVGIAAGKWTEATVADLVVDLGDPRRAGTMRDRLAAALGDSSLVIGYWIAELNRYVDDSGGTIDRPEHRPGRVVTEIAADNGPLAILIHDQAVADDPRLLASVGSAVRIAVTNARLQAQVRHTATQLEGSRRRIVRAADAERLRLAGELERGPERHLVTVGALLVEAAASAGSGDELAVAQRAVQDVRDELRILAQGVRPAVLTNGGLAAAAPVLAARSPVPVDVAVVVGRLDPAVEGALYFACSEALTNIAKHASATRASMRITSASGVVTAVITDDGVGGASDTTGTGLRGLADRIEALGGAIAVHSPPGAGTRIVITLPANTSPDEGGHPAGRSATTGDRVRLPSGSQPGIGDG